MKSNRGITLTESLCYIVVFSIIILQLSSFLILVNKVKNDSNIRKVSEMLFIKDTFEEIHEEVFLNNEKIIVKESNNIIYIYGKNHNELLLQYNRETNEFINGIEDKSIIIKQLDLEFIITDKYILFISNNGNYKRIIKVG